MKSRPSSGIKASRTRHVALRTCAGCRRRDAQSRLLRVVRHEGAIAPDLRRALPGRGAYVHPAEGCVERAARGGFSRSFRARVDERDVTPLRRLVAATSQNSCDHAKERDR